MTYAGVLSRYRSLLDIPAHTTEITLLEGNTPLIPMPHLAEELGGGFELVDTQFEEHQTPFNTVQKFVYCRFRLLANFC